MNKRRIFIRYWQKKEIKKIKNRKIEKNINKGIYMKYYGRKTINKQKKKQKKKKENKMYLDIYIPYFHFISLQFPPYSMENFITNFTFSSPSPYFSFPFSPKTLSKHSAKVFSDDFN